MDLKEQLLVELSRVNANYIANYVGTDPEKFKELIQFVFDNQSLLPERASWVITKITDNNPEMLKPYLKQIISKIETFKHHGTRRNILRSLTSVDIPENFRGKLFDLCYHWLLSKDELPAVKVHSMQILYNIAKKEPDLLRELKLIIEELADHESAAIRARSIMLLEKLKNKKGGPKK